MTVKRKYLFFIIWLAFIVYASLSPVNEIPKFQIPRFDKIAHFCMYFGLAFLLVPIVLTKKKLLKTYLTALIIAACIGIIFEFLQFYMNYGRTSSIYDELANTIGALAGIIVYHLIIRNKKLEKLLFKIE